MRKVSCIIPTYNEEARIVNVLRVVVGHPLLLEILIVDDGSKDATVKVINDFLSTVPEIKNIRLIVHQKNQGKSAAVCTGMKEAVGEFVLFLDADLVGLTTQNITDLISPVVNGSADVSISLRKNAPGTWHSIGLDYISGERVFRRSLLINHIEKILVLPKFGLEVYINSIIIKNKLKIKIVSWPNVESPFKYWKYGWYRGITGDVKMMMDIFRTVTIFGPVYQIVKMRKLIIK